MPSPIRYFFLYDDHSQKISARPGEADAPIGILRKQSGQEIRTQFVFSEPDLSESVLAEHCRRLFDFSEWIIASPQSQQSKITTVIQQFFGDTVKLEKIALSDTESEHWHQLLNDNFNTLTRLATELIFVPYQIRTVEEQQEADKSKITKKLDIIKKIHHFSLWLTLILFSVFTIIMLNQQFNIYAKITRQELHCYYNETFYPDGHENNPERELGDRLFPLIRQRFQWIPSQNDSLLVDKLEKDSSGIAISLLSENINNAQKFIRTNPYLSSTYVMLTLKKDYENQLMDRSFKPQQLFFGYLAFELGKSTFDSAISTYKFKSSFNHTSYNNIPQQFEQTYCDILFVSKRLWDRISPNNSGWKSNFRLLGSAITDTLFTFFSPLGKNLYDFYAYIPSAEIQEIAGIIGIINTDRTQLTPLLNNQWTELLTYQSFPSILAALRQKEIGVAILPAFLYYNYALEKNVDDLLVTGGAGEPVFYFIALNRAQANLVDKFNSALEILDYEVSRTGFYQNIFQNQITENGKPILEWFPATIKTK